MNIVSIADPENLLLAVRFVRQDKEDEDVVDALRDIPYWENLDAHLKDLSVRLINGEYEPRRPTVVERGKGNYTTRPMSHIALDDWIVAQATLNVIAEALDSKIPEAHSFAMRVNPNRTKASHHKFFKRWYREWPQFRRRVRANVSDNLPCMVVTDITGYYEHVDFSLLSDMILEAGIPREIVNLIMTQLEHWTWRDQFAVSHSRGLLQGNDISSLYANFYLREVDEFFKERGIRYHRYMDDMVIHVEKDSEAKALLGELTKLIRRLGLSLNSGKTRILVDSEIVENFSFEVGDLLEDHLKRLGANGESTDLKSERKKLRTMVTKPKVPDAHLFKRLITVFTRARDRAFLQEAVRLFGSKPDLVPNLCRYFLALGAGETGPRALIDYLKDPAKNVFPSQEHVVMETLLLMSVRDAKMQQELARLGWKVLRKKEAHPYSRALSALLVYRFGTTGDVERLVDRFLEGRETHPLPKKHLAVAVSRLVDEGRRRRVIELLKEDADPNLTETGLFMEQLGSAGAARVKGIVSRTRLRTNHYDRPKKTKVDRVDTRDIILLNLCRGSSAGGARDHVRRRVVAWQKRVDCPVAQNLLGEIRGRL